MLADVLIDRPDHYELSFKPKGTGNMDLDAFGKTRTSYNGVTNNCSDYVEEALEWTAGKQIPTNEKATENLSVTTPNQVYKAAKTILGSTVLKDAEKEEETSSLKAATGDRVQKAVKISR